MVRSFCQYESHVPAQHIVADISPSKMATDISNNPKVNSIAIFTDEAVRLRAQMAVAPKLQKRSNL